MPEGPEPSDTQLQLDTSSEDEFFDTPKGGYKLNGENKSWMLEMLQSANNQVDPMTGGSTVEWFLANLFSHSQSYGNQWSPSEEQIRILEMLNRGGLRFPTQQQFEQITSQLTKYGKIEDSDVYRWFEAREAERQGKSSSSLSPTGTEGLKVEGTPSALPIISGHDKGKSDSFEGKRGTGTVGSMSFKASDFVSQEQEGSDNSKIEKFPTSPRVSMSSEKSALISQEPQGTKVIVSLDLHDDKCKQKAIESVYRLSGVKSVSVNMKEKKLTVIGDVDVTDMVRKLRKLCHTSLVSVGPAKEPDKKKEPKKKGKSPSPRVSQGDKVQEVSIEGESGTWELLHRSGQSPKLEPTPEHKIILELLFKCGLLCTTLRQMEQIIKQLSEYGKIESIDVYQWFQARQDEERNEQTSSSLIPTSTEGLKPNMGGMDMDGVPLLDVEKNEAAKRIEELLSDPEKLSTYTQWKPTPEQKSILELLYNCGLLSPTMQQILQITEQLSECGKIEGIDVYAWFRARQAEEGQEQTSSSLIPRTSEGLRTTETLTSPRVRESGTVSVGRKSGTGKMQIKKFPTSPRVGMSSKMSGLVSQEQQGRNEFKNKVIVSLDLHDDKCKQKAIESVCSLSGVDSVSVNMKEKKLTVIGDVDAIAVVGKLRKLCHTSIVSVGPANEPEKKKEEPKKLQAVSIEEASRTWELISMSNEMSGPASQEQKGRDNSRYDNSGKLLPINPEKQREFIPPAEESIEVMANTLSIHRQARPYIPSLPRVSPSRRPEGQYNPEIGSPSANSTEGEETQPEGQDNPETASPSSSTQEEQSQPEGQVNMEIADSKKRWWFKLFPSRYMK